MKMPILRKINAGLGLITILILFLHISFGYRSLEGLDNGFTRQLPGVTMWFISLHTVVAILTMLLTRKSGTEKGKLPLNTLLSRISGFLMLIPLILNHREVYASSAMHTLLYAAVEILFCALVCTHIATSAPRAIITLGMVKTTKTAYLVTTICRVLCALIMVDCVTLILHYIH